MLLLFVVALFCRLSATFMCSCVEDHEHEVDSDHTHEVHICCSCPDHISDCSHHDKKYQDHSCHFHFAADSIIAEEAIVESRGHSIGSSDKALFVVAYCILYNINLFSTSEETLDTDNYHFSVQPWRSASCSLRAPPVLA